jgi:hypothetical protein
MKALAIALSGPGRGLSQRVDGADLTNVQYKPIKNYHYESPPPYNEHILIKIYKNRNKRVFSN